MAGGNFLISAAAAQSLSVSEFGVFGLGWGALQTGIFYIRIILVPLLIVSKPRPTLASLLIYVAAPASLLGAGVGLLGVVFLDLPSVSVAFALTVMSILVFEMARGGVVGYLSAERRHIAIASDLTYLVGGVVVAALLVLVTDASYLLAALLGVSAGSALGVVVAVRLSSTHGGISAREWISSNRAAMAYGIAEWAAFALSGQVALIVLAIGASTSMVAGIRGGQILLFPLLLVGSSIPTIVAPAIADSSNTRIHALRVLAAPALLMCFGTLVWCVLVVLDPAQWVESLLADSAEVSALAFPLLVVGTLAGIVGTALAVFLRSEGRAGAIARTRWINLVVEPALVFAGAHLGGVRGAAAGLSGAQVLGLLLLLLVSRRSVRHTSTTSGSSTPLSANDA